MGLEAWSRGYTPVTCVEKDGQACGLAKLNARGTDVQVLQKDATRLDAKAFRDLALVFGDPPYLNSREQFLHLAPRIRAWMAPGGILVWETEQREELPVPMGWLAVDSRRYGAARFHFFQVG